MKLICVMNGWDDAPHCWFHHLFTTMGKVERTPSWWSFTIFGFVFFFDRPLW